MHEVNIPSSGLHREAIEIVDIGQDSTKRLGNLWDAGSAEHQTGVVPRRIRTITRGPGLRRPQAKQFPCDSSTTPLRHGKGHNFRFARASKYNVSGLAGVGLASDDEDALYRGPSLGTVQALAAVLSWQFTLDYTSVSHTQIPVKLVDMEQYGSRSILAVYPDLWLTFCLRLIHSVHDLRDL